MAKRILILFAAAISALMAQENPVAIFQAANAEYQKGNFEAARDFYESLIDHGNFGAEVFYNLGNSHYRLGEAGSAALNYRRALVLQPQLNEARSNLQHVQDQYKALLFPNNTLPGSELMDSGFWLWLGAAGAWVALFCLLVRLPHRPGARVATLLLLALISGGSFAAWASLGPVAWPERLAIVIEETRAHYAPTTESGVVEKLPPGSEVRVRNGSGGWSYVMLPGERLGYVREEKIERVLGFLERSK